jgi:hypothetical protein
MLIHLNKINPRRQQVTFDASDEQRDRKKTLSPEAFGLLRAIGIRVTSNGCTLTGCSKNQLPIEHLEGIAILWLHPRSFPHLSGHHALPP